MPQHGRQSGTLTLRGFWNLKSPWEVRLWFDSCFFQYFEYTTHKELRHNIGKQLCLHANPQPEPVKMEICQLKGKGTSVSPQQEWIMTEVRSETNGVKLATLILNNYTMLCNDSLCLLCRKIFYRIQAVKNVYSWEMARFRWTTVMLLTSTSTGSLADFPVCSSGDLWHHVASSPG